jgi:PAS domain-containing protein
MAQKAVELILMRQLASSLAMPILLFDPDGTLLFYNEPAEVISGRRFEETGEMRFEEWSRLVHVTDEDGTPVPFESRPLGIALRKRHAAHRKFWAQGADGVRRKVEATAFPLEGQGGRYLGAVLILWESPS